MSSPCGFGFSSLPEPASPSTIETLREREIEGSSPIGIGFSSDHENTRSPQSLTSSPGDCTTPVHSQLSSLYSSPVGIGFSSSDNENTLSPLNVANTPRIFMTSPLSLRSYSTLEGNSSPASPSPDNSPSKSQSPVKRRRMLHCDTPSTCAQESSGQRKTKRSLNYEGDSEGKNHFRL
ncbi:uncharacterized protein LOC114544665 [Dendronephthya gigantea]|uniref:uncharacterized protein LOC114544665 n=1 Tax=Dendronephthya gigantea TaxID=151771 RepID=UPI00106D4062|nr:uncharacterized protein LOC114544665 [Dendronephthya gigantea]